MELVRDSETKLFPKEKVWGPVGGTKVTRVASTRILLQVKLMSQHKLLDLSAQNLPTPPKRLHYASEFPAKLLFGIYF